ncbi:hypothetical protein Amal_03560 [Acetobacter malorum]|uniref:Uncharacterized protein n=1 Tax=Acetobacter malorum TaxID=178901 RepID=A0A177G4I5_9PROT|nr:hypothetical protein Amal_03560 [Acetobacter malorum]
MLLCKRWRPETVADGATDCNAWRNFIPGRDFTVFSVANIRIMLEPASKIDIPVLQGMEITIQISCPDIAAPVPGILRAEANIAGHSPSLVRRRCASLDLISF